MHNELVETLKTLTSGVEYIKNKYFINFMFVFQKYKKILKIYTFKWFKKIKHLNFLKAKHENSELPPPPHHKGD